MSANREGARDGDGPPLRREDAKSSGGDDLCAEPFTDHVFDDNYYGRSGRDGGGRSYGLVIGVVLGLVIAGGAGYFAFRTPSGPSMSGGAPPVIKADATPYKTKPDDPGGMQVENQDKLVYERVSKGDSPSDRVENLLPPAEEPKEPPPKPVEEVEESPTPEEQPAMEMAESAAEESESDDLAAAVASATGGRESSVQSAANTEQNAANTVAPPVQLAPSTVQSAPETEAEPVQEEAQTAALSMPDGAFLVQLAAARSNDGAEAEWKRLSGQHEDLLGGLKHMVLQADLGERGIFYRLRVGPLADRAAAEKLCADLTAENVGCIVVRP